MKVEKKIIRKSFDYKKAEAYYREASICPNCGADETCLNTDGGTFILNVNSDKVVYVAIREGGTHSYECTRCGCQWEVENFK